MHPLDARSPLEHLGRDAGRLRQLEGEVFRARPELLHPGHRPDGDAGLVQLGGVEVAGADVARIADVPAASAAGADLENLVALFGLRRETVVAADPDADPPVEAVLESDERLKRRIQLFPASISTAGPKSAYRFHSLNADPRVKDVDVAGPDDDASIAPGGVRVTVLAEILAEGDTGAAPQDLLDAVEAALSAETVRPMGDVLAVQSAGIVEYRVRATLQIGPGPDPDAVLAASRARAAQAASELHAMGRGAPRATLIAALHAPGALNVNLASPAADVAVTAVQAARAAAIEVTA
jgi:phage-related baseplate assembly protein